MTRTREFELHWLELYSRQKRRKRAQSWMQDAKFGTKNEVGRETEPIRHSRFPECRASATSSPPFPPRTQTTMLPLLLSLTS